MAARWTGAVRRERGSGGSGAAETSVRPREATGSTGRAGSTFPLGALPLGAEDDADAEDEADAAEAVDAAAGPA
ncbi:hypothetical protein ADK38_47860, partial [Streptomyces varsoviensis]